MKKVFQNLPVILLISAIALSPSFSAGEIARGRVIEIRVEDILIIILGLVWIANFFISGRGKIEKPPLLLPILAWLGIGFISVLTNLIFGNLEVSRGFFYFLKEIEYFFIYFYLFYHIRSFDSAKFIIKFWIFLGALNVAYVIYQIATGSLRGEQGPAAISEWGVFPTGGFFLLLFIFFFNIFLYYFLNLNISNIKKGILAVMTISPVIGVFGTASRTNFFALIVSIFLTLLFLFAIKKRFKLIFVSISILILIASIFIFASKELHLDRVTRITTLTEFIHTYETGRVIFTMDVIEEALRGGSRTLLLPFIGYGKGYVGEAHSQYARNFVETGIVGSIIFLILIFAIIKKAWLGFLRSQDAFSTGIASGLLVATLTMLFMSLAVEVFLSVKPSEVYWSFAAITMAVLTLQKSNNAISTPSK